MGTYVRNVTYSPPAKGHLCVHFDVIHKIHRLRHIYLFVKYFRNAVNQKDYLYTLNVTPSSEVVNKMRIKKCS